MARYTDEYDGITGGFREPRGLDPNYRGGYRGMRMAGGYDQAQYGRYRLRHRDDFQGEGGFDGRYDDEYGGRAERYARDYRPEWQGGGVRDPRYDREFIREFNANSPMLRPEPGEWRGGSAGERPHHPDAPPGRTHWGYDPRYTNRGLSGGFAEGWARGPMRGAR